MAEGGAGKATSRNRDAKGRFVKGHRAAGPGRPRWKARTRKELVARLRERFDKELEELSVQDGVKLERALSKLEKEIEEEERGTGRRPLEREAEGEVSERRVAALRVISERSEER